MHDAPTLIETAATLREAFDHAFAAPPAPAARDVEDLLAIGLAGRPYAILLRDVAAIVPGRTIVPVPAGGPSLLGVAGIRGDVVPVFGLASLLGCQDAGAEPSWLVVCRAAPVALGFAELEGYMRLPRSSLEARRGPGASEEYVSAIATTSAGVRAVLGIPQIVASMRNRVGRARPRKED
jgi:purine-binding chemotaxis protein CheW